MRFDYLLIGFLMIALFAFGGSMIIGDMNSQYGFAGVNVSNDSFNTVYDATTDIYTIAESANNQTLKAEIEGGSNSIDSMIRGTYTALRLVGSTFGLFDTMIRALADTFKIPQEIIIIFFAMFIITVIFALIYMIFRYVSG